jgi:cell division protein FtsW (lipid II flippase)
MNVETISMIVASLVLALLGIVIILGKADWAIKQYRRNSERYNIARLRVVTGVMLIILALILPFIPLYEGQHNIFVIVILSIAAVFAVLQETWARRR